MSPAYYYCNGSCCSIDGAFYAFGGHDPQFVPTPLWLEGTGRVGAEVATAETGERLRGLSLVDGQLGECAAQLASDGQLRCLPPSRMWWEFSYSDPACTQVLFTVPTGAAAPTSFSLAIPSCGPSRSFTRAMSPTIPPNVYTLDPYGGCHPYFANPSVDWYTTSELDTTTFPPITRELD